MSSDRRSKTPKATADLAHAHERLKHLYEISKLFATFENVDQTFDTALGVVTTTLPLHSAILIESEDGHSKMILWPSERQDSEEMRAAKAHVEAAYSYLVGTASAEARDVREQAGRTALPLQVRATSKGTDDRGFVVIPLVVRRRPIFGVLQLEASRPLEETDLVFINALANQLAIALDRDRAWQRDISRREQAEERGASADQKRRAAQELSEKYEALALENRSLFEQAQQAIRVREQILAIVSHDLKTPLGTILLATASLAKKTVPEEQRPGLHQGLSRIQRSAERIERLVGDLLDFASIEAGRLGIKLQAQPAGALIKETLTSFEADAEHKGLRLTAEWEPTLPDVCCDRDRVLQVISNLVGNATKATPAGGQITLRAKAHGDEVIFAVSDTGPGISEEDLTHLFERYWRSDEASYSGTGLGLAIARGIVKAHGGRIWAESQVGRGSTFHFTLPTVEAVRAKADDSGGT